MSAEASHDQTIAEILAEDSTGALALINGEVVLLVKQRRGADCGHPISGRDLDQTRKEKL